jgi:transcriptional regulator with XRE-family HTH domain
MKLSGAESNQAILKEMGIRIKQRRISLSVTQKRLSELTGVSLRTIVNVENGKNVSFDSIISLLKALRVIDNIDDLIPENKVNPLVLLASGHERKRASGKRRSTNWKWGDEK